MIDLPDLVVNENEVCAARLARDHFDGIPHTGPGGKNTRTFLQLQKWSVFYPTYSINI